MKNSCKSCLALIMLLSVIGLSAAVDPLYQNLINEGKDLLLQKQYERAAEKFRIAEFGVSDNPEIMRTLLPLYALALFYQKRKSDSKDVLLRILPLMNANSGQMSDALPPELQSDFLVLLKWIRQKAELPSPEQFTAESKLENSIQRIAQALNAGERENAKKEIAGLDKNCQDDPRILYFKGRLTTDSTEAIDWLSRALGGPDFPWTDEAAFHLVRLLQERQSLGKALAYAARIKTEAWRQQMQPLVADLLAQRRNDCYRALEHPGDSRIWRDLLQKYDGDPQILPDLFQGLIKNTQGDDNYLLLHTQELLRWTPTLGMDFVTTVSEYFANQGKINYAISVLETAGVAKSKDRRLIGLIFRLGEWYALSGKKEKARQCWGRVLQWDEKFQNVKNRLDNLKN